VEVLFKGSSDGLELRFPAMEVAAQGGKSGGKGGRKVVEVWMAARFDSGGRS